MADEPTVQRIVVDVRGNTLVLELSHPLPADASTSGTIDIGALGRLIGVEIDGTYLSISDPAPGSELQGRSVDVAMTIDPDRRRLSIPRRGPAWELSFPSGNQCWNRRDERGATRTVCAVLAGS